ncbi:MAG: PilX N-terminal domain-containing pilus assembly protein [Methylococcaceae bacterium]|jgi:Tfp pilus assembly protein PilX
MNIRVSQPLPTPARQRGAVTLLVALMLLIGMSMVTITTMRSGMVEQQTTGNDVRAREAQEAAEAGLEYGVAWAKKNKISNTVTCSSGSLPTGCPTALTTIEHSPTGERYTYTLTYTKGTDSIKVTSAAQGIADNNITATSEVWIKQISYLTKKGKTAPPFVINGNLIDVNGNPEIHTGSPPGPAFIKSPWSSIDTGMFNKKNPSSLGAIVSDVLPDTPTPAWDYTFSTPLATATGIAIANGYRSSTNTLPTTPEAGKEPFYLWDSASEIKGTYGKADNPVVIIITAGNCPKIGATIYGLVYFSSSCSDQGWGGAEIHGSVISDGNIVKLTANTEFYYNDITGGAGEMFSNLISDAASIPGTWKDF